MEKFKPGNKTVEEFEDYEGFVEKFKPKKTTDDCYTPPAVYAAVLEWVKEEIGIADGLEVIRPFYPGGNYQSEDYAGKVVIDNPPFSILAEIIDFYQAHSIPFFLFAPRMTCLSGRRAGMENLTAVFGCKDMTYENGAVVPTAFLTNMMGDVKIRVSETLAAKLKAAVPSEKKPCRDTPTPTTSSRRQTWSNAASWKSAAPTRCPSTRWTRKSRSVKTYSARGCCFRIRRQRQQKRQKRQILLFGRFPSASKN
ncbi:Uncharacterised protein [Neisseria meningitidis]|uniref:hypothetical protein n=1 Tax=Neisseria meningitidis TaxID=487 RepID=UPI0007668060|nr:hypothetical protein [Neisseria meningitidis]CWO69623.1 Uncharacterised protein [Neisseria meningitidis]CWS59941.1 Uncharacterised protein [Neisseria meningitidis]